MNWSLDTQLKVMLVLYFLGALTMVLWIPAGLFAIFLYWRTKHSVAKGGVTLFWHSLLFWLAAFFILPFSINPLAIMVPALIIACWAGYLLYRSVQLWGDLYVTPMD